MKSMKKIRIKRLFQPLLMATLLFQPAMAMAAKTTRPIETPPRQSTLIILDGSNSMWGQLQGINKIVTAKIVTARKSLTTLLKNAHDSIDFGLLTYGDRHKRDCSDFTLVSKPEDYDQKTLLRNIGRVKPYGRSPIAEALKKAAASLPEQHAHILLVSDGQESCGGDPCAVAAELHRANPNLQIDVIGFRNEKGAQLECIAENSHGAFVVADNTERLKTLLAGVRAKAQTVLTNQSEATGLPGSVEISIKGVPGSEPVRANFSIYTPDGNNVAAFTSRIQVKEYLKPGNYRVKAQWQGKNYTDQVSIRSGQTSNLQFDARQVGVLKLSAVDKNNQPVKVNYSLYLPNGDFISRHVYQNTVEVRIPSTEYRIKADWEGKILETRLMIESGKENAYIFRFD